MFILGWVWLASPVASTTGLFAHDCSLNSMSLHSCPLFLAKHVSHEAHPDRGFRPRAAAPPGGFRALPAIPPGFSGFVCPWRECQGSLKDRKNVLLFFSLDGGGQEFMKKWRLCDHLFPVAVGVENKNFIFRRVCGTSLSLPLDVQGEWVPRNPVNITVQMLVSCTKL